MDSISYLCNNDCMKISLKTINFEITPLIKDYLETKINHLDKFFGSDLIDKVVAFIELEIISKHHNKGENFYVKVDIQLPGKMIRAKHKSDDLFSAIDKVKDILSLEFKKYKEKKLGL
ncbi:ribosome-associated translation inhibitor RaiA [Candidatus Azambacteria bacterium]|nr:ribosome-associated translation inhibitor RaiA [Candidatus Azambacteria bacterium]